MNKNNFRHFKSEVVKVNLSSTFITRVKCRRCGKSPKEYYYSYQPNYYYDPCDARAIFDWFKKYIKRMNSSWYQNTEPRNFHNIEDFSFNWIEQAYKPALHQYSGLSPSQNIIECLICPCGKSVWAFNKKSSETRPEIKNRKARYNYPQKFESY